MTAYDSTFTKDPDAVLDYTRDWTTYLGTDTIATSEWLIPEQVIVEDGEGYLAPAAGELVVDSSVVVGRTTIAWLSGGTESRIVTNRITTASGRTDDRSFLILIKET